VKKAAEISFDDLSFNTINHGFNKTLGRLEIETFAFVCFKNGYGLKIYKFNQPHGLGGNYILKVQNQGKEIPLNMWNFSVTGKQTKKSISKLLRQIQKFQRLSFWNKFFISFCF